MTANIVFVIRVKKKKINHVRFLQNAVQYTVENINMSIHFWATIRQTKTQTQPTLPAQIPYKVKVAYKEPIELSQVTKPQGLIVPTLVNVRKKFLTVRGFRNYTDWANRPNSLYIGRYMRIGDTDGLILIPKSKWQNPFKLDKDKTNIGDILKQYEEHVRNTPLYDQLHELIGKELGCWCKGLNSCHGDVLIKLFKEKFGIP